MTTDYDTLLKASPCVYRMWTLRRWDAMVKLKTIKSQTVIIFGESYFLDISNRSTQQSRHNINVSQHGSNSLLACTISTNNLWSTDFLMRHLAFLSSRLKR